MGRSRISQIVDKLRAFIDFHKRYISIVYETNHPDFIVGVIIAPKKFFCETMNMKSDDAFFANQDAKRTDVSLMTEDEAEAALINVCDIMNWSAMDATSDPELLFAGNDEFLKGLQERTTDEDDDEDDDEHTGYLN